MAAVHCCVRCRVPVIQLRRRGGEYQCCVCLRRFRVPRRPRPPPGSRPELPAVAAPDPESDEAVRVWGVRGGGRPKLMLPRHQDQWLTAWNGEPSPLWENVVRLLEDDP